MLDQWRKRHYKLGTIIIIQAMSLFTAMARKGMWHNKQGIYYKRKYVQQGKQGRVKCGKIYAVIYKRKTVQS